MARSPGRDLRRALNRAYQRFNALQRGEKKCFGVTMPQCMLIEALFEHGGSGAKGGPGGGGEVGAPGRMTVRELAAHQGLDTSTVTRLVDVLSRDGLARRDRDEGGDRRRVYVSLTERGRSLGRELMACADSYCERIFERVPAARREAVLAALDVLVDAMEELPAERG